MGANLAPLARANVIQLSEADLDPLGEMNSQRGLEWAFAGEDLRYTMTSTRVIVIKDFHLLGLFYWFKYGSTSRD